VKAAFLFVVVAMLVFVVGACGAEASPPWLVRHYLGLPPGVALPARARDTAEWVAGAQMAVLTWGSSGCPSLLKVSGSSALTVTVTMEVPSNGANCPADLAATTSVIRVPIALDVSPHVSITIVDGNYGTTVTLLPRPVSDH
jgi:hypothetical protein